MADIIEQTRVILLSDPTVAALVAGERIYPGRLEQGTSEQSIVLQNFAGAQGVTTDGPINHSPNRLQVDCYGLTYSLAEGLFIAVRKVLNGYSAGNIDGIFLEGARPLYDTDASLYRQSADFQAWNREG